MQLFRVVSQTDQRPVQHHFRLPAQGKRPKTSITLITQNGDFRECLMHLKRGKFVRCLELFASKEQISR